MGHYARDLMRSIGERADAVDHLLRAPLAYPSAAAYRRYLSDLYGFAIVAERASARCEQIWRRTEHSVWLAAELAAIGCTSADLAQTRAIASRAIARPPMTKLDVLAWAFVVSRMASSVPAVRHRLELHGDIVTWSPSSVPSDADLTLSTEDVARQLEMDSDTARLRFAVLSALDAMEDWAMVTAAASAEVAVSLVRFV